jgi:xylulokinase
VSCSTQWSVTVPVDRDGNHLANAVHWMDARGAQYTREITDGLIKVAG